MDSISAHSLSHSYSSWSEFHQFPAVSGFSAVIIVLSTKHSSLVVGRGRNPFVYLINNKIVVELNIIGYCDVLLQFRGSLISFGIQTLDICLRQKIYPKLVCLPIQDHRNPTGRHRIRLSCHFRFRARAVQRPNRA